MWPSCCFRLLEEDNLNSLGGEGNVQCGNSLGLLGKLWGSLQKILCSGAFPGNVRILLNDSSHPFLLSECQAPRSLLLSLRLLRKLGDRVGSGVLATPPGLVLEHRCTDKVAGYRPWLQVTGKVYLITGASIFSSKN